MTLLLLSAALGGCQTPGTPVHTVAHVDLPRFMGDWYVIANIPTFIERGAHNAVESYRLAEDGRILTEFTFNADAFDGPLKRYTPTGYVKDSTGAVWGMQFVWPIKADYRVMYLASDYSQTIIGREKRDYVWIMARRPSISDEDFARHVEFLRLQGYDTAKLQRVPQQEEADRGTASR
jgi:apolipoprotein D and lipocalin family protein